MNASRVFKLIAVNLMILFAASCALKIPAYVGVKTNQVSTIVNSDLYMAGLYYDDNNNLMPSYWINDQRITCDFPVTPIEGSAPNYLRVPMIAVDNSNDMFMAFTYKYGDANNQAGLCINRTYQELLPPEDNYISSIDDINDIVETNGEIYVIGNISKSEEDCLGVFHSDQTFVCATIWKSSTGYTPEFVSLDTEAIPAIEQSYAISGSLDNGHVYILGTIATANGSDFGYWLDDVFHKQTSLLVGIPHLYSISLYQIKVYNGTVYESGTYTINSGGHLSTKVFYIKNGTLFVIDGMQNTEYASVAGMDVVNDVVYMAANLNSSMVMSSVLITGDQVTTLSPKDGTYYTFAYGLAVNSSGVAYVVGTIFPLAEGFYLDKAALWSTNADPRFYDNVSGFTGVAIK